MPEIETVVEDIPVQDFEVAERPVVPISDGDPSTRYLEDQSQDIVSQCGMEFNKCYALYLHERPEFFLSAIEPIDSNNDAPVEYGFEIIEVEDGLENAEEQIYNHSVWRIVAGLDDEAGSISFQGVGYPEPYYLKTVNGDMLRMKALSASNGMMVYK